MTTTQSPQERIAVLRALVDQRWQDAQQAQAVAERAARRQAELRQQCVAHAEMLAEAVAGLNGLTPWAPDSPYELQVWTNGREERPDTKPILVGLRLFSQGAGIKSVLILMVAHDDSSVDRDAEEPIFWLASRRIWGVLTHDHRKNCERLTFAAAVDRMVFAAEELFEQKPEEDDIPFSFIPFLPILFSLLSLGAMA